MSKPTRRRESRLRVTSSVSAIPSHLKPQRPDLKQTLSQARLNVLVPEDVHNLYGLKELREGFFDPSFVEPTKIERDANISTKEDMKEDRVINDFYKTKKTVVSHMVRDKNIAVLKAFVAYFLCYCICLINPFARFTGFAPILLISVLIHHPGRSCGSQMEITLQSVIALAFSLGWSSLALFISTSTGPAQNGRGGLYAVSLIMGIFWISWLRSSYIRFYHCSLTFALGLIFMTTVDIDQGVIDWGKIKNYTSSYCIGMGVALIVNFLVFPDFGHSEMVHLVSNSLQACRRVLVTGTHGDVNSDAVQAMNEEYLLVSEAFREFSSEISFSSISIQNWREIRNILQLIVTGVRALPSTKIELGTLYANECIDLFNMIASVITEISDKLLSGKKSKAISSKKKLESAYIKMGKIGQSLASARNVSGFEIDLHDEQIMIRLLYVHHLQSLARDVLDLANLIGSIPFKWRFLWPAYPLARALRQQTRQINHDKGGQSAAYYFRIEYLNLEIIDQVHRLDTSPDGVDQKHGQLHHGDSFNIEHNRNTIRFKVWAFLHSLQSLEGHFAIKTSIIITLICLPGWVNTSHFTWYNIHDCWTASILAYLLAHTRVAGNFVDYITRITFALLGIVWGGIAYRADYGNPYVMGAFAAVFMIPCFHRFIASKHPRSGFIGCISFTLVSMGLKQLESNGSEFNIFTEVWVRGLSIVVGISLSIVINYLLWPFRATEAIARSTATILDAFSHSYQIVVDRYLYKDESNRVTRFAMQMAAIREARMLQWLSEYKNLLYLTHHEPSLRKNFSPIPYHNIIQSCEVIHQRLCEARISTIYFSAFSIQHDFESTRAILSSRRDAVASLIFVLYILSNAHRSRSKISSALPSALMARKLLHENMKSHDTTHVWQEVHVFAFSKSFTDITTEIEKIIGFSKAILGEG